MKNKLQSLLLFGVLSATLSLSSVFSQEDEVPVEEPSLSDGPQTLPVIPEAPATESVPLPIEAPVPETKTTSEKVPPPIVSEEELLLPPKKTAPSRVKSNKVTESEIYIQEADKYKLTETYKNLQLNDVIEQGLRKNYDQNIRAQQFSLSEIKFEGAKNAFWLPELKINLTTSKQHISTIRSSSTPPGSPNPTTPTGSLGLSLGDYTVFNWGKDYALYLNKKSSFTRSKEAFEESKRELKLNLIESFFNLMTYKNIEKIRQDELRQASFVYRLNKEKITIGKTSKQDYYLARSEYLKAQNDYHDAKIAADTFDENMAFLITDTIGTKYILNESLEYLRIKISLDESMNLSLKNNPDLLSNKTALENAERSYDVAIKENMPLPKFTMNLGAYTKKFGPTANSTTYETYSGSGNIELVASINAAWSLTGEDGFFNSNKLATSRLEKEIAFKELDKTKHFTQSFLRQTYKNILSLQNQIVILEARIPSLQKSFDTILENYLSGKTKYYDFHLSLKELIETRILFEQTKFNHLQEKLRLAKLAGIEDFPGENFEHLASRIKGK